MQKSIKDAKSRTSGKNFKIFAGAIIAAMAFFDYLNIYNLFHEKEMNLSLPELVGYSLLFAILLEGIPLFLGIELSTLKDNTEYKENEKIIAKIGFRLGLIGIIVAILVAVTLRILVLVRNGGLSAYVQGNYAATAGDNTGKNNKLFSLEFFLIFAPALTSLLSFIASWVAFKANSEQKLNDELSVIYNEYDEYRIEYIKECMELKSKSEALWSEISDGEAMPKNSDVFTEQCSIRIRRKMLVDYCIEYEAQYRRFNDTMESFWLEYIKQMGQPELSIMGLDINSLDIHKLIKAYDDEQKSDKYKWYNDEADIANELKILLNNSITVKHYKATINKIE
ncbi:MAG: hypothetical protein LBT59_14770 [Clostridiales bacterium]|jgi:hypothetical protein|nr:hypothetical protein [Clostridiales bacterium]